MAEDTAPAESSSSSSDTGSSDTGSSDTGPKEGSSRPKLPTPLLYLTVLIIATSGLVYELLAATLASYVLGDSVLQFSTTIGAYLFAMGIGSFLSRYVGGEDVARRFLEVELGAALLSMNMAFMEFTIIILLGQ